jgi:acyl-CoA carboxylase epsilon subunit-like protein
MIGEIQILRGSPDATELATVLAVLCTMRHAAEAGPAGRGRVLPAIWEEKYRHCGTWETGLWRTDSTRVPTARRLAA